MSSGVISGSPQPVLAAAQGLLLRPWGPGWRSGPPIRELGGVDESHESGLTTADVEYQMISVLPQPHHFVRAHRWSRAMNGALRRQTTCRKSAWSISGSTSK
jgi:hypothetical protein